MDFSSTGKKNIATAFTLFMISYDLITHMSIHLIKEVIESFAPLENAESWDNTGILIDSQYFSREKKVLLTIDFTLEVEKECVLNSVHTVLAYHPAIFRPINAIIAEKYVRCLQDRISVYSPHTQLDPLMNLYLKNLLPSEVTLEAAVEILKKECLLEKVRVVNIHANKKYINLENVVVGVGSAFRNPGFRDSLIITGEMSHHDMLKCRENRCEVILLEHSNSERVFLKELKKLLLKDPRMADYEILISKEDKDPVEFL